MASIPELQKTAHNLSTIDAIALLQAELAGTPRKGAITALLDHHLRAILDLAVAGLSRDAPPEAKVAPAQQVHAGQLRDVDTVAQDNNAIGVVHAKSGLLVVIDASTIDEAWKPRTNAHDGYVVDIVGSHAQYLADREGSYQQKPIPGGVRVVCNTVRQAQVVADQARSLVAREGWDDQFTIMSKGASYAVALDAAREAAGPVAVAKKAALQMGVFQVAPGSNVQVRAYDGRLVVG